MRYIRPRYSHSVFINPLFRTHTGIPAVRSNPLLLSTVIFLLRSPSYPGIHFVKKTCPLPLL